MTEQAERYDRMAAGYARWWAPVLAPAVGELLDEFAARAPGDAMRVVDIGTGTGQLALGALQRWPGATIVGVDASSEMRAVADLEADRILPAALRDRFRTVVAFADDLPFEDGSFDAALSSFVFQLVPRRAAALREARRVLRPGGTLAYVTWLHDDRVFLPDRTFDDVLDELGIGGWEGDGRSGDLPSAERAAGEMRHAGFADVVARAGRLEHRYTVESFIAFLREFDEESLFDELDAGLRRRLVSTLRTRLGELSPDEMTMRSPIVFVSGRRSRA
jgi:ubiquinone/menaquinone biosynthesis C-methylase UbiE